SHMAQGCSPSTAFHTPNTWRQTSSPKTAAPFHVRRRSRFERCPDETCPPLSREENSIAFPFARHTVRLRARPPLPLSHVSPQAAPPTPAARRSALGCFRPAETAE